MFIGLEGTEKYIKVFFFFWNIHLDLGCKGNLCQHT